MRIVSMKCRRFAGLEDTEVSFSSGLNVLLGSNEAGKSTLVESMLATLFQNHRLSGRSKRDKEFAERFFPHPNGDHAEAELIVCGPAGKVRISRSWSFKAPFAELEQGGGCIREDSDIDAQLKRLLGYGEGTYAGVVFARQNDLRSVFERITQEEGLSESVGAVLRRAVMEMDGVNVDRLSRNIDEQLLAYSERWDSEGDRPEGNRGIANPFKKGVGKVLESYYEMENHRTAMLSARESEDRLARETDRLHGLSGKLQEVSLKLAELSVVEPTLIERSALEAKAEGLKKEQEVLRKLAVSWPEAEIIKQQAEKRLGSLCHEEETLQKQIANARNAAEIKQAVQLIEKHDELTGALKVLEKEKCGVEQFEDDAILHLREFQKTCDRCSATLDAATIIGRIVHSAEPVEVAAGLSEPAVLQSGESFTANGFMRLIMGNAIQVEVRSGEIDFEAVQEAFKKAQCAQQSLLSQLKIVTLEEAEAGNREMTRLTAQMLRVSEALEELAGQDIEALRRRMAEAPPRELEPDSDITVLEGRLSEIRELKSAAQAECSRLEGLVEGWVKQYGSRDHMLDAFGDISADMKSVKSRLEVLPELPAEFASVQMFQEAMRTLRVEKDAFVEQVNETHRLLDSIREKMDGLSAEELKGMTTEAEKIFVQRKLHMKRLQDIRNTLMEVRADLDTQSFEPLEKKFAQYFQRLTVGKYQDVRLCADYGVEITGPGGQGLPTRLFSAGTLDAAALSFKFALLDLLFQDGEGFAVLDDCLVNLDPERQNGAAGLIKEYAQRHQVIFTTCSPDVAKLLGGNSLMVGRE